MKTFTIVFTGIGLLFLCIGVGIAWNQDYKIRTAAETRGKVLSTRVETKTSRDSDGRTSTSYKPIVEYEYAVDGQKRNADQVFPHNISAGSGWAHDTIRRFSVGQEVPVFYNPKKPQKAFLLAEPSFLPYFFILFPMVFVCVGLGIGISSGASVTKPPVPVADAEGWYAVQPRYSLAKRVVGTWSGAALWIGVGLLACGHFFLMASAPYETMAIVATAVYGAVGLFAIGLALYYTILRGTVGDAQIFIQAPELRLGDEITVGLRQVLQKTRTLEEVKIGLACDRDNRVKRGNKTTYSTNSVHEQLDTVMENHRAMAGETLQQAHVLPVPADKHPSSPRGQKGYPRYRWKIRLEIAIDNAPDYKADFPLMIHAADEPAAR